MIADLINALAIALWFAVLTLTPVAVVSIHIATARLQKRKMIVKGVLQELGRIRDEADDLLQRTRRNDFSVPQLPDPVRFRNDPLIELLWMATYMSLRREFPSNLRKDSELDEDLIFEIATRAEQLLERLADLPAYLVRPQMSKLGAYAQGPARWDPFEALVVVRDMKGALE